MVNNLSVLFSNVLVAIIAGTLHPNPIIRGINDFPCNPILCINLSIIKAARAIYPESSIKEIKKNNIKIFGKKTITPPTPAIIPSTSKSRRGPSFRLLLIRLPSVETPDSIQFIGYCPIAKVAWNINHIKKINMGNPHILWVNRSSSVRTFPCAGAGSL